MDDADLTRLMAHLLPAHANRCGSPKNEVRVNTEDKAKDDGCDGWSSKPTLPDSWFGSTDTCWQFKAGSAGEPARLKGEVRKAIPSDTLSKGGRFVVIASGSTNGKKGEIDRKAKLLKEARTAALPLEIDVIGSERLASWCNEHPAVAAYCAGRPAGLWTLEQWAALSVHRDPWQGTPSLIQAIDQGRTNLDFATGIVLHLHIQGHPGVGKTRFALELCRNAAWAGEVVYVPQAADARLLELIDSAAVDMNVRMLVVADEAQANQLTALRDSVERANGRIRIITIGSAPSPDPARIPALRLEPLDGPGMREVVSRLHPGMPREQVDFVVRFADGYIRLARLAANAVAQNPEMDVRGLLNRDEIRVFMDKMLGDGDRTALYVVAALTSVGWSDDKKHEGEAIAAHFGLRWTEVRLAVDRFNDRVGIAPRSGRYRYISPTPLGNHLAMEAWTALPDLMKTLPKVLPSEEALAAFYERIRFIASNPKAREFAREQLSFFFRIADFTEVSAARCWSALSSADPPLAARNLRRALATASLEDRAHLEGRARRELIWALVRIAWQKASFREAVISLALLAEAENETWANNATGEFLGRFQIFLGGTATSYSERLQVVDEILAENRSSMIGLVIKALGRASKRHATRSDSGYPSDEAPEPEWRPSTPEEYRACVEGAINRLVSIAKLKVPELRTDLINVADDFSMMLRDHEWRGPLTELFNAIRAADPDTREPIRRIIDRIVHGEKAHWKNLAENEVVELEALRKSFEGSDLSARLQQLLVRELWSDHEPPDLRPLAQELLANPENLNANWSWLTSGDASDAWRLGVALEAEDEVGRLAERLPQLQGTGKDLRVACGYICARRERLGDRWYDDWIAEQGRRDPRPIEFFFELSWRCAVTKVLAKILAETLTNNDVEVRVIAPLGFGKWGENLGFEEVHTLLRTMSERGYTDTAIQVLAHRLESHPSEIDQWEQYALELVTTPELIRSGQMPGFYWDQVASRLTSRHASQIAAALFREQAKRDSGIWFIEHSETANVLNACIAQDAQGVWEALKPHLEAPGEAILFTIGFPPGVVDRMPASDVAAWISVKPHERASIIAKLASKDLSNDDSLSARLLGQYGDNEEVAEAFLAAHSSDSWWGSASSHYATLANNLDQLASRTSLPKLRLWARDGARSLREIAQAHAQREQEGEIGRR